MTVTDKFDAIAKDLTYNVTKIYGRDDIIIASDLVFHSVLSFNFRGNPVEKGWTEAIIIGDTRSGKSATLKALHKHYRVGEFITGEDISRAGLIGGMQNINGRWVITWGRYVRQNREECTIDETQNLKEEDIANMSGMRSSGVAEITMIHQARTEAKVRAIWLGNPRANKFLDQYSHGILAIKELVGKLDDIARFDIGMVCAANEVGGYNVPTREKVPHIYTSDSCHNLIMWVWSRKHDQVEFVKDADIAVLAAAETLAKRYTPQIPLVNAAEMRIKVARLAVAAAARLFSTDKTFEKILVTPEHVEFIHKFLVRCYDKPSMGYDIYTDIKKSEGKLPDEQKVIDFILEKGKVFLDSIIDYDYITVSDIMDFMSEERDECKKIISFLTVNKCIKRYYQNYVKNPAFNQLLRKLKIAHQKGTLKFGTGDSSTLIGKKGEYKDEQKSLGEFE